MRFGMPSLIEIQSLEATASCCRALGLCFVELNMNLPEYQANRLDAARLRQVAEAHGLYFTLHLDENLNPCDFNERVAAAYTQTVLQTIEIAKAASIPVLNMHLHAGVWFTLPDRKTFLFDEYELAYLQKLREFRNACEKAVGGADIKICIENSDGYTHAPFLQKGLGTLLESPAFALTLDVGHNAATGFADEKIIAERIHRLHHMHLHDAKEKRNHFALGQGTLEIERYLKLAQEQNCRVVLEVKTEEGLRQSVDWLRKQGAQ